MTQTMALWCLWARHKLIELAWAISNLLEIDDIGIKAIKLLLGPRLPIDPPILSVEEIE